MLARVFSQRSGSAVHLSRSPLAAAPATALLRVGGLQAAQQEQVRHAATLKSLVIRMRSIANMKKITKAMKMVATAKFKKDVRAMEQGLPFAQPVVALFGRLGEVESTGTQTILAVSTDKGLCGGVNNFVCKAVRADMATEEAKGNQVRIMVMGGKGVSTLKRLYGDRFNRSFEELAKVRWNYTIASLIADRVVSANPGRLSLIHNQFKSMVVYNTLNKKLITVKQAQEMDRATFSKAMDVYSFEPSIYEVWQDLHEFYYGACIYSAYLQNTVTETSQRMSAMENASKNASEMFDKVSLTYNRARQAKITTELCEIISGASAV